MSNYFQHLAMRALGQVQKGDAQPTVRSRFEPESQNRSLSDVAVGNGDPGATENSAMAVPKDQPVLTSPAPRSRAASTRLPMSAPVASAGPPDLASQEPVRAADSPIADFSEPVVTRGPARLEIPKDTQAAAHTAYENSQPTFPREPSPIGLSEDLSAQVPGVVAKVGETGTQPRRPTEQARVDSETSPDAAPVVKTSKPAAAPAEKSLKVAMDGFGVAEDTVSSQQAAGSDSSALLWPLGNESATARTDLVGLGSGSEVGRDTSESARTEPETEERSEGQKTQARSATDAAKQGSREKPGLASQSGPPATPDPSPQPSPSAEESRSPKAVLSPVSVVPSASAPSPVLPAPQVHIRIGRIEVRAPAAKPVATSAPVVPARTPSVALSDYLKQTRGRG